jgi:hypothetical protein
MREESFTVQLAMTVAAFYLVNKCFVNADHAIHNLACLETAEKLDSCLLKQKTSVIKSWSWLFRGIF